MKKVALLALAFVVFQCSVSSQTIDYLVENVDYISPFHDGVAAIKKGEQWGFINSEGTKVVDFRNDVVLLKKDKSAYPIFNSDRSLIVHKKEGISYFGYIDKTGKIVIEPQFLNATHFNEGTAIALKLVEEVLGRNDILDKKMISHHYFEVTINTEGRIMDYLTQEPKHITLSKYYVKKPPEITCRFISDSLIAIKNKNRKWSIKKAKD